MPIAVEGILAVEGEPTGDGRMLENGALEWDGVLPIPIIWDREDGDHSGATLGAIEEMDRRVVDGLNVIWGEGYLSDSEDPETQNAVVRARELIEEGAVGVSVRYDSQDVELRVKKELIEEQEAQVAAEEAVGAPIVETTEDGERVILARFSHDDALEVTTRGRVRHLAIVDTAAIVQGKLSITGQIAAAGVLGDWDAVHHFFDDPKFGDPSTDKRLRYDPDRGVWSCPPTVTEDGQFFGHITPMGICLRGRPDRCVTPPDGDLEGFMRGRAPAAGGRRTGVVCVGGSHCDVGIGAGLATEHYDKTGKAVADIRVGRDRYGVWFSGMVRPGADEKDVYALAASDVSGHWEYTQKGRMTLVGLPAVNVGGFPKGYLTYEEFTGGLAAAGGISADEGCGAWDMEDVSADDRLRRIEFAVGEMYAGYLLKAND